MAFYTQGILYCAYIYIGTVQVHINLRAFPLGTRLSSYCFSEILHADSITNNKSRQQCFRLKHKSSHKIRHSYDIKQKECIPRGGTPGNSWWEGCLPILQILTRFQTQKCTFPHQFSDQTSKIHTRFQTWPLGRNFVIVTQITAQTKKFI